MSDERQSIPFISKATDSESTWRTARNWIDWCTSTSEEQASVFCKRTHSPCQNIIIDEKLPTRLVYVSESNKGIRLCLTKEISFDQGKVNYTALTHCWGLTPMPILTNRDNFQQMLCGIPFQSLTKTFQDAIIITRRLGYKYVWIDSLCILQGDIDDWVRESGIMGSIFAGCSVNIVAAAARDGSVGCFFDRDPAMDYGFKAYAPAERDHKRTLWNFYLACKPKCFPNDRAWCFQETLLAPRSLYFYRNQVYWQCRVLEANEAFPQGLNHRDLPLRSRTGYWGMMKSPSVKNVPREWFELVNSYSGAHLTYWKDKLPAISGIARAFCREHALDRAKGDDGRGQHYLAGLWRYSLEEQLFWLNLYNSATTKPGPPHPPSWSWSSVAGSISGCLHSPSDSMKVNFRVLDVQVTLATEDEYGAVTSGRLVLQCHTLIPVTLGKVSGRMWEYHFYLSVNSVPIRESTVGLSVPVPQLGQTDLFVLHGAKYSTGTEVGLLLQQAGTENTFHRVGSYWINTKDVQRHREISMLLPFHETKGGPSIITII